MIEKNDTICINKKICRHLFAELQILENKCDRITLDLSEVKKMIVALPPNVDILIDSIETSAINMHEQSIRHREYVERCISGKSGIHLMRRVEDGEL